MNFKKWVGLLPLLHATSAWSFEPFVIKDIRVEGIQRTEPGTVFSYLPVKVGDTLNDDRATASLHALFATGFFKDVELKADQNVLVVSVKERPTVASVEINGVKDFPKDQLRDNLKIVGLAEGRILDKSVLDKSVQELKRQYVARGKYSVEVKSTVKDLERNRVAVSFDVNEGSASKIREINIVGNQVYPEKDLLDVMQLTTPGLFTWFSKNDQYSKQKLSADMESIRTFYMNSGYMDFAHRVDSSVDLAGQKRHLHHPEYFRGCKIYRFSRQGGRDGSRALARRNAQTDQHPARRCFIARCTHRLHTQDQRTPGRRGLCICQRECRAGCG